MWHAIVSVCCKCHVQSRRFPSGKYYFAVVECKMVETFGALHHCRFVNVVLIHARSDGIPNHYVTLCWRAVLQWTLTFRFSFFPHITNLWQFWFVRGMTCHSVWRHPNHYVTLRWRAVLQSKVMSRFSFSYHLFKFWTFWFMWGVTCRSVWRHPRLLCHVT